MPIAQRLAGGTKAIGAAVGKPIEAVQIFWVKLHAIGDALFAVLIIEAAPMTTVEQRTSDIGRVKDARFLILELVQTAAPAAVAQRLPLATIKARERLFPKWRVSVHLKSSLALLSAYDQAGSSGAKLVKQFGFAFLVATALIASPAVGQ